MPVARLRLKDFGAFGSAELDFVDGLNVFLGANGTGKTHAMKLIYAMLTSAEDGDLGGKLAGVFRPDEGQIGRLARRVHGLATARVSLFDERGATISFQLHTKGNFKRGVRGWGKKQNPAVFLPSREVLALYEGFIAAYQQRELSFDETYFDACVALNANPIKGPRKDEDAVLTRLRGALNGHTELTGNRFYVKFHGDKARMEAHLVAEGLRKVASLERLLLNGSLTRKGFLLWDEPEANLHPRLTVVIADILGALATMGVQVFITTHDFLLARRLSVKASLPDQPATRFFLFHRPDESSPVQVHWGSNLSELPENPIEKEFARHYDFEVQALSEDRS